LRLTTLTTSAEFQRVHAGSKWAAKAFVLQGLGRDEESPKGARFGFAVGSRALAEKPKESSKPARRPGAVMRNRARRRLKEAVRLTAPHCARPDFDYVIIGRREALHQSFADLLEDMQLAFGKVHRPPRRERAARPTSGPERVAGADQRKT
jgi:ribonuclease P protein component